MCKNILIIRLSSIGDVIHCTPVARSLKMRWPDCKITWLVGQVAAELIQENPTIDKIIIWSREKFEGYLREWKLWHAWKMWRELQRILAEPYFDAVLDIQGLFLTGMISRLVNTRRRIGMTGTKEINWLFMTERGKPLGRHITQKYLGVLTCLGIHNVDFRMCLAVAERDRKFATEFLQTQGVGLQEKIGILILGTTWQSKNWPLPFFEKVIILLAGTFKIILCGSQQEVLAGQELEEKLSIPIINTIGLTGLLEMAAIMERASVVIAGDTGPLHMAAALGIPTVGLFGPTDPIIYAPQGSGNESVTSQLPCSYCHKKRCRKAEDALCMRSITPEAVVGKVGQVTGVTIEVTL